MAQAISLQRAGERWVHNSLRANPDRIRGIVRAYFSGQSLRWAAGLLKSEDTNMVLPIMEMFKNINPLKYQELSQSLRQE